MRGGADGKEGTNWRENWDEWEERVRIKQEQSW